MLEPKSLDEYLLGSSFLNEKEKISFFMLKFVQQKLLLFLLVFFHFSLNSQKKKNKRKKLEILV
jgi:hypothetical protein